MPPATPLFLTRPRPATNSPRKTKKATLGNRMSELTDRKVYRNLSLSLLFKYRLPLAGILSILHRISGAALFLFLPFLLYLFRKSLASEISFRLFSNVVSLWYVKILIVGLSWAFLHHLIAGVRYLIMDLHVGLDKDVARKSSVLVFAISLPVTLVIALKLFGAF
jgi:succinate dehydrogenase / fumarate reductase cytochrome b subunit